MGFHGQHLNLISTHTLRVEGDQGKKALAQCHTISTHTLRVEGDSSQRYSPNSRMISTHTLRVEGDLKLAITFLDCSISTHTLRVEGDSKTAQIAPRNFRKNKQVFSCPLEIDRHSSGESVPFWLF